MSFEQNKYQVIRQAIGQELASFCFNYFLLKRNAVHFMYEHKLLKETPLFGSWSDVQVPGAYSHYGDHVMETLLVKVLPVIKQFSGLDLVPTYSYARLYEQGHALHRHKDRPSCEISATLNLGGDLWPIFIDPTGTDNVIDEMNSIIKPDAPPGIQVDLAPGDLLIYSGCELEHWRHSFEGRLCGQVFLHYNHRFGCFTATNTFDRRPALGLPPGLDYHAIQEKKRA